MTHFKGLGALVWIFILVCHVSASPQVYNCTSNTVIVIADHRTHAVLYSPGYPNFYPRPLGCNWKIYANDWEIIVFSFKFFDVEPSIFCFRDYISIIDGGSSFDMEIMNMCGSYSSNDLLKTSESIAQVEFNALTTGQQRKGFEIWVWAEEKLYTFSTGKEFNFMNYILMVVSSVLGVCMIVAVAVVCKMDRSRRKREKEKDENVLERRA